MRNIESVAIIGGGPAGAYCAYELAKQGLHPVLFDHSHPREKPCGGGISPPVIDRFPFVENLRSDGRTFGKFRIISCTNFQVTTQNLENGFCVSRRRFDKGILNMATKSGARLIKEKVLSIRKEKYWRIKTAKRTLSAHVLIGADGVNSIVRKAIMCPISTDNLALTFGYIATSIGKDEATIKFLGNIPGYIWVFPGKRYSNVGIGSELQYGSKLKQFLDEFLHSHYPRLRTIRRYSAMLPSGANPEFFELPCAGEDWILIGDAAGHVDPISGGGILYALWDGELAARAIKANDPKSYDAMWREAFGKNLKDSCIMKDSYYDPVKSTMSIFMGLKNKKYSWLPLNK